MNVLSPQPNPKPNPNHNPNSDPLQGGGGFRGGFFLTPCPSLQTRLDDNEFAAGVFVDLKTAFDTVDHQILIAKPLQRTGFVLI